MFQSEWISVAPVAAIAGLGTHRTVVPMWRSQIQGPAVEAPAYAGIEPVNLKTFGSGVDGFDFNGPHDTHINYLVTDQNARYGAWFSKSVSYDAAATVLTTFHAYSNGNYGLYVDTEITGTQDTSRRDVLSFLSRA
jgi:hypothetical protein